MNPGLLEAIRDIAIVGSAAHDRRQTEEIRACLSIKDLKTKLNERGFKISESAVYLRILPRCSSTREGRRHVVTVPVRLCKPQNDLHKSHPDGFFCTSTIRNVDELASFLGPKQVAYISQDDKARVQIGVTAANKQAPRLMHLEYRIQLPDHDWVVAAEHKLIPSVYAGINIRENGFGSLDAVSYSGLTYIAIRSGKHSSSTAATHALDFDRLMELESFNSILKDNGEVKPVVIISVDGGPDENPQYCKSIACAIEHFKKYSLDAIFVMTNAPGRSAFNRVERRIASLSRELSGVILPYNFYGEHLDSNKRCIDEELELKNFAKAGETLAEIWSEKTIDKYPVFAEYINPNENFKNIESADQDALWYQNHVRESQYFAQIVKCDDPACCAKFRSDLKLLLPDRFFPPPLLVRQDSDSGRIIVAKCKDSSGKAKFPSLAQRLALKITSEEMNKFPILPYDFHCPTVQEDLSDRICPICNLYFATKKSVQNHRKRVHPGIRLTKIKPTKPKKIISRRKEEVLCLVSKEGAEDVEWIDGDDIDCEGIVQNIEPADKGGSIPVIESMEQWLRSEWTTD